MVNIDLILALVFYALLFLFFLKYRHKFEIQGKIIALYKTRLGLRWMDKAAKKYRRLWEFLGTISIGVGFLGMILILSILIKATYDLITIPDAAPALVPLLPGVSIPGLPILSFWHWIITIFVLAIVHEFAHGLFARVRGVRVKSSGFAFLGPILGAFVEVDEKQLGRRSKKTQLEVFSAGPFSNLIFGALTFLIYAFLLTPLVLGLYVPTGIEIVQVAEDFPANLIGIEVGEKIIAINEKEVNSLEDFLNNLEDLKPNDIVIIETNEGRYEFAAAINPQDSTRGYLGISVTPLNELKPSLEKYSFLPSILIWFRTLFLWMFIAQIGVGLFNLLPLGIVDGGRMFFVAAQYFIKNKDIVNKVFIGMTTFVLILIFINLLPWLFKLFNFLIIPFT